MAIPFNPNEESPAKKRQEDELKEYTTLPTMTPIQGVCPCCGYCPTCGRAKDHYIYPYYPTYPWYAGGGTQM